jgi:glycosyltransferase involved in cell wall biosynthesis
MVLLMRILLLVDAFRSLGGIEEIVDYLAAEFVRMRHEAIVVSTPYFEPGCERAPRTTAECVYLDIPSRKPVTLRHFERLLRRPAGAAEFAAFLERRRPDVINSHIWQWDKFPTVAQACRDAGVPLVQSFDTDVWGRGRLGDKALRALSDAAGVTVLSQAVAERLAPMLPAARGAHVMIGGVDCAAASAAMPCARERPYIFSAARLDLRHKALDILIAAFAEVAREFPALDLLLAGDGPDRSKLRDLAESLGIGERIVMLGVRPHQELWSLYKGAEIFAMPSRPGEAMGLVFLEAMACATPVAATRSGGIPEIVPDGVAGIIVEPDDALEFAGALRRLLNDRRLAREMGMAAQKIAAEHGWAAVAERYLRVYESCLR